MALSDDMMLKCSVHLSGYKSACEDHPDLKAFDSELQQQTMKVIDSLTIEDKTGKVAQHSVHMEVSKHLLEVTEGVANFITESKTDVWKNESLRSLVDAYFENTIETLKIFNNIASCVEKAEMGELLIQVAIAEFDKESAEKNVGGKNKKYEKTLKNLKAFKDMGDPFSGQVLTTQFELIKKQQDSLLKEVTAAKEKIEKEITRVDEDIKITNAVFAAAIAAAIAASIALIATGIFAPAGIAMGITATLLAVGWALAYSLFMSKRNDLVRQLENLKNVEDLEPTVDEGININEEATKTVSTLVEGLEDKIVFMLKIVDNAIEIEKNEKAIGVVLNVLREKVEELTKKIKMVGESVERHSALIAEARLKVQQKIVRG